MDISSDERIEKLEDDVYLMIDDLEKRVKKLEEENANLKKKRFEYQGIYASKDYVDDKIRALNADMLLRDQSTRLDELEKRVDDLNGWIVPKIYK